MNNGNGVNNQPRLIPLQQVPNNTQQINSSYPMMVQQNQHVNQSMPLSAVVGSAVNTSVNTGITESVGRVVGSIFTFVTDRVLDRMYPTADVEKDYDEMYDKLKKNIDNSHTFKSIGEIQRVQEERIKELEMNNFTENRMNPYSGVNSSNPFSINNTAINPVAKAMKEAEQTKNLILEAYSKLDEARNTTRCSVCKNTLKQASENIKSSTFEIIDATDKVVAMQYLKINGMLDKNKTWEELTQSEKQLVKDTVKTLYNDNDKYDHVYTPDNLNFIHDDIQSNDDFDDEEFEI